MSLFNADDLVSRKYIKLFACEYERYVENDIKVIKAVPLKAIDNAPTVDIVALPCKRPQGEWLPNYTSQFRNPGRQCSICGRVVEFSENFCPRCGAIMRPNNE